MAKRLVTMMIAVDDSGAIHSDVQTHDNSYADVANGFVAIRSEMDRVFAEQRNCPHFPSNAAQKHKPVIRDQKGDPTHHSGNYFGRYSIAMDAFKAVGFMDSSYRDNSRTTTEKEPRNG